MTTQKPKKAMGAAGDPLAAAAAAYAAGLAAEKAAIRAVEEARRARQAAGEKMRAARDALAAQIVAEAKAGIRQKDILERLAGVYTRESVRRICREAGVEPND
ncbi:hypothetical protein [Dactylosporangium sp. CA-139066]|uniref:hypothetical protein n=1 Tax=Dactylosporangium sp. CA-139066 TaxID=3239930 RepID=UPI003D8B8963